MTSECTNESNLTSYFFFLPDFAGPSIPIRRQNGKGKRAAPESIYLSGKFAGLTARGFFWALTRDYLMIYMSDLLSRG